MGNDGFPMSLVILVSVALVSAMLFAGAIALLVLSKGL